MATRFNMPWTKYCWPVKLRVGVILVFLVFFFSIAILHFKLRAMLLSSKLNKDAGRQYHQGHEEPWSSLTKIEALPRSENIHPRKDVKLPFLDLTNKNNNHFCPLVSPLLVGWTNISLEAVVSMLKETDDSLEQRMKKKGLKAGGRYKPTYCRSRHNVAIIVPFRKRIDHLVIFLRYMHPFLQRQQLNYCIIIVEQTGDSPFNRGMLLNIGFKEAEMLDYFQCIIFHDVDMLPEDDRNLYSCPEEGYPRQMSFTLDDTEYQPMNDKYFGGVTALSANDFKRTNGFSNKYWGWGGEDDDFYRRVRHQNLTVTRSNNEPHLLHLARYRTIYHREAKPISIYNNWLLNEWKSRVQSDGLVDLAYKRLHIQLKLLFTHIVVSLKKP